MTAEKIGVDKRQGLNQLLITWQTRRFPFHTMSGANDCNVQAAIKISCDKLKLYDNLSSQKAEQ